MTVIPENADSNQIIQYLKSLEKRLSRIEAYLNLEQEEEESEVEQKPRVAEEQPSIEDTFEIRIHESWLPRVGIVVFAIGIAFLLTLLYNNYPPILPTTFGYFLVGGIFLLSHIWRKSFAYISRYLLGGGMVLFYYITFGIHYISEPALIISRTPAIVLLLAVVFLNLYISTRRESVYLCALNFTMGYFTALASGNAYLLFFITTLMALFVVYYKFKFKWNNLIIYGIILTYLTHFLWYLNHTFPFLGDKIQYGPLPQINLIFILIYASIFAAANLLRSKDQPEDNTVIMSAFLNSFGGFVLFLLISLTTILNYKSYFVLSHGLASIFFLIFAVVFWLYKRSKFSTFFYSIIGYTALSVAIIAQFKEPDSLIWLSWQSILVISTAIWFRSKFIILANFIIYVIIFLAYLGTVHGNIDIWSLSFGIVALLSARVLNWKKDHLELKTELMRNSYLVSAFFIFPYALYHLVPGAYVALSWVAVTLLYYMMSLILDNKKYRWMALLTLLMTVLYVFIIGIAKLELVYRVISFLVLGIVLIALSLIYNKMRTKSGAAKSNS